MRFSHSAVDGAQLGASLIEGDTRSETRKEFSHAMDTSGHHGCRKVVRTGDDVGHDFRLLRIGDGGFEDADDRGGATSHGAAAEKNRFADDARIFPESGGPQTVGENDHAGSLGAIVLRSDETMAPRLPAWSFSPTVS